MIEMNKEIYGPTQEWWILLFSLPFQIAFVYIGCLMIGSRCILFDESNGNIYSYKTLFCGRYKKIRLIGCIDDFDGINLRGTGKIDKKNGEQEHIDTCYNHYSLVFKFNNTEQVTIGYQNSSLSTAMSLAVAIDDYWQEYLARLKKKRRSSKNHGGVVTKLHETTTTGSHYNFSNNKESGVEIEMIPFVVTEQDHDEMLEIMKRYSVSIGLEE